MSPISDLKFCARRLDNLRFAGTDQNPGGIRDLLHSAIRHLESDQKTLRDEFAMAAMAGLISHPDTKSDEENLPMILSLIAKVSYKVADAMLAARAEGGAA